MRKRINLQFFAESGVEDTVPPAVGEGQAAPPVEGEDGKEKDVSKVVAARLGHERKRMEAEYGPYKAIIEKQAQLAGMDPKAYLEYVKAEQEKQELEEEAEKTGKSPETVKLELEKAEAEARARAFERKERLTAEEREMVADPVLGKFVQTNLEEIREIAEKADVPFDAAVAVVARKNLPELLKQTDPQYHKDAIIKEYLKEVKERGTVIDISGAGSVVPTTAPKTFDEALKNSTAILRAQKAGG